MPQAIIYQMFTRLFGNRCQTRRHNGTLAENGVGKFNDIDTTVLRRLRRLGCTHVWYTGVLRHATTTDYTAFGIPTSHPAVVKGKAGSPYAVADYYDVDPDMAENVAGRMREFERLVERTHKVGMKVVMDFVPNHVARQYHSVCCPGGVSDLGEGDRRDWHFATSNNFYYCWGERFQPQFDVAHDSDGRAVEPYEECPARATGNDCFTAHPGRDDWYETVKLNYGIDYCDAGGRSTHFFDREGRAVVDTWHKMTDILLYWAAKGIDAFRCDMAEMVPPEFWQYATGRVRRAFPKVQFIGEVYCPGEYRRYIAAGFDLLYDKVGMYDTLRQVVRGERPARDITARWQETDDIAPHMLYFLENHDEQRVASDHFAGDARRGIPALLVAALSGKAFMLYAGEELGERGMDEEGFSGRDGRTTIFDYWSLDTLRHAYYARREMTAAEKALEQTHIAVLTTARDNVAANSGQFYDLMYAQREGFNSATQYAFMRHAEVETLLVVANFADREATASVVIPRHAFEFLGMAEGESEATELLTGRKVSVRLAADEAVEVQLPACGGVVVRMHNA